TALVGDIDVPTNLPMKRWQRSSRRRWSRLRCCEDPVSLLPRPAGAALAPAALNPGYRAAVAIAVTIGATTLRRAAQAHLVRQVNVELGFLRRVVAQRCCELPRRFHIVDLFENRVGDLFHDVRGQLLHETGLAGHPDHDRDVTLILVDTAGPASHIHVEPD